jgi:hypothetical protein
MKDLLKFKDVKYDEVVDKYGCVINLDLAKYLIYLTYCGNRNWEVQDWVEKCQKSLEQIDEGGCEFSLRNPETGRFSLGGPGGYSGYIFTEFNKYCEEYFPEDNIENYIGEEETINECPKVVVVIEDKPRIFIITESD